MSLQEAYFAIRQRKGVAARKPKITKLGVPKIAPPPSPTSTKKGVPIRSPFYNLTAKRAGNSGAKVKLGKATGTTVTPKAPVLTPIQQAEENAKVTAAYKNKLDDLRPKPAAPTPPTEDEKIAAEVKRKVGVKEGVENAKTEKLRDEFNVTSPKPPLNIPFVTPAVNSAKNAYRTVRDTIKTEVGGDMVNKGFTDKEAIYGTLGAIPFGLGAGAYLLNENRKNKEKEQEKQEQAEAQREKIREVIARRDLLREQRGTVPDLRMQNDELDLEAKRFKLDQEKLKAQQPKEVQPKLPYNFFSAPQKQAEFWGQKPKPTVDLKKVAGVGIAGYGLLAGVNKKRNADALRINQIKDAEDRKAALEYYNSGQYNIDSVLSNIPNALSSASIVPDTLAHPLIAPAPEPELEQKPDRPRWTNYRTQAAYSKPKTNNADFFLPLIAPAIGIAGAGYGLYRRKKEAQKKDEVLEAEKLAALDRIQDPELRSGLLSKARGQLIDDQSRSQLVDSALNGDYKSALGIGLKKINLDSK